MPIKFTLSSADAEKPDVTAATDVAADSAADRVANDATDGVTDGNADGAAYGAPDGVAAGSSDVAINFAFTDFPNSVRSDGRLRSERQSFAGRRPSFFRNEPAGLDNHANLPSRHQDFTAMSVPVPLVKRRISEEHYPADTNGGETVVKDDRLNRLPIHHHQRRSLMGSSAPL